MSKLLAIVASLKAILVAASVAFARGDMLPVILISVLLNLAQLGAKLVGQVVPRDTISVSRSHERRLQPDLVGGDRIVPVASVAASRDLDASSSTQRVAT